MGLVQVCCSVAWKQPPWRYIDVGVKSLGKNLGDAQAWPHSYYLIHQYNEVGRWVRLKYMLCRCKINGIMEDPHSLYLPWLFWPLCSPGLFFGSNIRLVFFSYLTSLRPLLSQNCSSALVLLEDCRLPLSLLRLPWYVGIQVTCSARDNSCSSGWPIGNFLFPGFEYRKILLYITEHLPCLEKIKQPSHHTFQQDVHPLLSCNLMSNTSSWPQQTSWLTPL